MRTVATQRIAEIAGMPRGGKTLKPMNHSLLPQASTGTLPAKYEAAKVALMECNSVDECKDWADKAAALASYARQSQDDEMEKTAMRIRARAVRRCGELLKEIEKAQGKRTDIQLSRDAPTKFQTRKDAAKDAGLSKDQAVAAIRVANVPEEEFEQQVESPDPPTVTKLAEQGKKPAPGKPIYEKLGMTKQQFQAGMYFRGDMDRYIESMTRHDPKDVASGSTPEERKHTKENLNIIDAYHRRLKAEL